MTDDAGSKAAWREHNLSQLLHFRSLTLREKLEAVEGMADVVRLLERMRARQGNPPRRGPGADR